MNSKAVTIVQSRSELLEASCGGARVIVIPRKFDDLDEAELVDRMNRNSSLWLVGTKGFEDRWLNDFSNTGKVRAFFNSSEKPDRQIKAAVAELKKIARTRTKNSTSRLHQANELLKAFTRAMIGIQRAGSIGEIEMVLNEALNPALKLTWVRIVFHHQTSIVPDGRGPEVQFEFRLPQSQIGGRILFGRERPARFTSNEKQFLKEITDTAALALQRLARLEEAETLKQQWEATFDAISHPLCLTNDKGIIIRTNRAFSRVTGHPFLDLLGKDVLVAFSSDIQTGGQSGNLRISRGEGVDKKEYEVISQLIGRDMDGNVSKLFLFLDVTEQLRLERKIVENSKLAELGTIASSIAHELNNPLGGILSFVQLIRMDLDPKDPIASDIAAMEEATLRCRDIVQNLLGFARVRHSQALEPADFRDLIERAIKLTALETKSKDISVSLSLPKEPATVNAQMNSLSQAVCNVVQNSIDAVLERREIELGYKGTITIELHRGDSKWLLTVRDDGAGIRPEHESQVFTPLFSTKASETNSGLGLTVAYSIIRDHSGELEIISRPGAGTTAVITLPASENQTKRDEFPT